MSDSRSLPFHRSPAFWLGLVFSFLLVLPFVVRLQPVAITLMEIQVQTERPDTLEIYWDLGDGYRAETVSASSIHSADDWDVLRFIVPMQHIKRLRLDPVSSDQEVRIRSITLHRHGESAEVIPWAEVGESADIGEMRVEQDVLIITPQKGTHDPQLSIAGVRLNRGLWGHHIAVRPQPAAWAVWFTWMVGVWIIGRMPVVFFKPAGTPLPGYRNEIRKMLLWGALGLVSLLVAGGLLRGLIWTGWMGDVEEDPILEIGMEVKSDEAEFSQLFFDTGRGFNEGQTEIISLAEEGTEERKSVFSFRIPRGIIQSFRWDPMNGEGEIQIHSLYLQWQGQRVELSLGRLFAHHDFELRVCSEGGVSGFTQNGGNDPSLLIREYLDFPTPGAKWWLLWLRGAACLAIIGLWLALLWVWDGPRRNLLLRHI